MTRSNAYSFAAAAFAGPAAFYLLPSLWLGRVCSAALLAALVFAILLRIDTKTKPPEDPVVGILLSVANLPEEPGAKVNEGWALTVFLSLVTFLLSMAFSVLVLGNV